MKQLTVEKMGFSEAQLAAIRFSLSTLGGVVCSGGCASGKGTFLQAYIDEAGIEKDNATGINSQTRKPEDLGILLESVEQGKTWFSVVHASSSINALRRISSISSSVSAADLISNAKLFVSLALVPLLCPSCAIARSNETSDSFSALLTNENSYLARLVRNSETANIRMRNATGCEDCSHTVRLSNGEESEFGRTGFSQKLTVISEVTVPDTKLLKIYDEEGHEAAQAYFDTLFRFESEHDAAGESKYIHGLRKLLSGEVSAGDLDKHVISMADLESHLKYIEDATNAALSVKNIQLKSYGGFNIIDLITSNGMALKEWRKEYAQQAN